MLSKLRPLSRLVRMKYCTFLTELTGNQLLAAEEKLKSQLPHSLTVYGFVVFKNRFPTDEPVQVLVDKWPDFNVVVCKPQCEEMTDSLKETAVFSNDKAALEAVIRDSSVFDWTRCFVNTAMDNMEIFKVCAAEKKMSLELFQSCRLFVMNDFSKTANPDSAPPGTSLSSLNESHVDLVYKTWNSVEPETKQNVQNMIKNFQSSCLLDSRGRPLSWVATHYYGALGMFYTHPDHRGKRYGPLVLRDLLRRLHSEGLPVFGFIEENNKASLKVSQVVGLTDNPLYRQVWFKCNHN